MLVSDVKCTLFKAHLVSVVFSGLNVALCPAMEVVFEFCLHRISLADGRRPWLSSPGLCIAHGGVSRAPDPFGAEDRRALLRRVHIAWLDEFYGSLVFGVPSWMSLTVVSVSLSSIMDQSYGCVCFRVLSWISLTVLCLRVLS